MRIQAPGRAEADHLLWVPTLYAALLVNPAFPRKNNRLRAHVRRRSAAPEIGKRWTEAHGTELRDGIGSTRCCNLPFNRPGTCARNHRQGSADTN